MQYEISLKWHCRKLQKAKLAQQQLAALLDQLKESISQLTSALEETSQRLQAAEADLADRGASAGNAAAGQAKETSAAPMSKETPPERGSSRRNADVGAIESSTCDLSLASRPCPDPVVPTP